MSLNKLFAGEMKDWTRSALKKRDLTSSSHNVSSGDWEAGRRIWESTLMTHTGPIGHPTTIVKEILLARGTIRLITQCSEHQAVSGCWREKPRLVRESTDPKSILRESEAAHIRSITLPSVVQIISEISYQMNNEKPCFRAEQLQMGSHS